MATPTSRLAHHVVDAFVSGDTAVLEQVVAADITDHNGPPGARPGRAGLIDAVGFYRSVFSDIDIAIEQELADGDLVALCGEIRAVHSGDALGVPATGRRVAFPFIDVFRVRDEQIVESWHVEDNAGLLRQVGVLPG